MQFWPNKHAPRWALIVLALTLGAAAATPAHAAWGPRAGWGWGSQGGGGWGGWGRRGWGWGGQGWGWGARGWGWGSPSWGWGGWWGPRWSIGVIAPRLFAAPPPVYYVPPPVIYAPAPMVFRPPAAVYVPRPVVRRLVRRAAPACPQVRPVCNCQVVSYVPPLVTRAALPALRTPYGMAAAVPAQTLTAPALPALRQPYFPPPP